MFITEIEEKLKELRELHGDLPVYMFWENDRKGNGYWAEMSHSRFVFKSHIQDSDNELICQPGIYL